MKQYLIKLLIICCFLVSTKNTLAHGFVGTTQVKTDSSFHSKSIQSVCRGALDRKESVLSYDFSAAQFAEKSVKSVGKSIINCYCKISINEHAYYDIICAPTQEFYVSAEDAWVPAYQLSIGTKLTDIHGNLIPITNIELIKNTKTKIYSIEVEDSHNFFVGMHGILAHNVALPALSLGFAVPFGSGAVVGGSAGSFLGPVTLVGGCVIGGLIGIAIKTIKGRKIPYHEIMFNQARLDVYFAEHGKKKDYQEKERDLGGAQAPGKPTEDDGYFPPKRSDGKKVPHPETGQYGWPDKKGDIWVPSGPNGHGGPHWDVVDKDGDHVNVLPGGKIRGKQ